MADPHPPAPSWEDQLTRLVQLGRDGEAAALATRRLTPTTRPTRKAEGALMDPRAQLDEIMPLLSALVAPLDQTQLDAPTPCATFTVRGVLEHMIGGATMFSAAFRGAVPAPPGPAADPVSAFPVAMADLRAAVHSPGALDRTIAAPFGDVPGDAFARFVALDGLVHGWDLATATGRPYAPTEQVVAAVDAFARQAISEEMRGNGMFGAAVTPPDDATSIVKLVAFTGRAVQPATSLPR